MRCALRGPAATFVADPFVSGDAALRYEPDALILIEDGRVRAFGAWDDLAPSLPAGMELTRYGRDDLILPGFIDLHVHYPQMQTVGSFGKRLIDWLEQYTYPAEQQFADEGHAREAARAFLRECLRAGTTTAAVFCTVHPHSVQVFFEESARLDTRMIAGKTMMDRNAPQPLRDTAQQAYDESDALMRRWHGNGRQLYAVTPRYAGSSTPAQLELAGALWRAHPGAYLQSHIAEQREEVRWVTGLYPERKGYLDIYDHFGLLGPRALYGHGIHLTDAEVARLHETGTAIAHCPTSNLFLGSGLLDLRRFKQAGREVPIGLASDVGAGTSLSMLQTMNEAYKVAHLNGFALSAAQAYYLATRGAARALRLEDTIGSIAPGCEADLIVLDLRSTPMIDLRMRHCRDVHEAMFVQMTLGDDRAVRATWVGGERRHARV
jgi:guanine deaminase